MLKKLKDAAELAVGWGLLVCTICMWVAISEYHIKEETPDV